MPVRGSERFESKLVLRPLESRQCWDPAKRADVAMPRAKRRGVGLFEVPFSVEDVWRLVTC